ncbi:unnamed protein product [Arabidopsis thaliana]|uniref:DUF1204 domain-containing protein n=1 Tax=Arabidopsis thaliana TaxID=3702 RepID=A0A654G4U7_ARATH|nr:unnamed protein product [Arabidopsis thaliana]
MGKASRQFPIYVDTFGEDSSVETDVNVSAVVTEQQQVVTKVSESGVIETNRRAASEDRMTRLSDAQARKKASAKIELFSVSHRVLTFPRGGSTQDIWEVDHSFSFNYDRNGYPFPDSRSYCGEFPRKVIGSSREIPPVESPIAKNLYQIWACKEVQSITTGNALYNFLKEQAREAREETVVVQKNERSRNLFRAEKSRLRSSRDDALRTARSERSRFKDDVAIYKARIDRLQKHILHKRVADESLFMQCQTVGSRKLLKKLIKNGTAILGETMCELKVDKNNWREVVDALEITDLLDDDLVAFPEFEDEASMTTTEGEARIGGT